MADQSLAFNVTALDNASKTFLKLADQVERFSQRLDKLDRKDVSVDVNANTRNAEKSLQQLTSRSERAVGKIQTALSFATGGVTGLISGFAKLGKAGPVVLGAVAAAAVAASGAIVALGSAAAAVAGGIGAAFAGIGIGASIFAQTERGKAALREFREAASSILTRVAAPLSNAFAGALDDILSLLSTLSDELGSVFSALGSVVSDAVDDATTALAVLGPSMSAVTQAGSAFFRFFADTATLIARNVAPALRELAPTLRVTAAMLGQQLGSAIARLLPMVIDLAERALPMLPGILRIVTGALRALIAVGNLFINSFAGLILAVNQGRIKFLQLARSVVKAADVVPGLSTKASQAALQMRITAAKTQQAAIENRFFGNEVVQSSRKLGVQETQLRQTTTAMQNYRSQILKGLSANIQYQQQLTRTTKELRQGAASFNINTREGQENAQAMLRLFQSQQRLAKQTNVSSKEQRQMARSLVRTARDAGFTTDQIRRLILRTSDIPQTARTRIRSNADSVTELVNRLIGRINDVPRYVRTVHDVVLRRSGDVFSVTSDGETVKFRQHGGQVVENRPYIVGERGPELFVPRNDGRVVSNQQLMNEATSGGSPLVAGGGGTTHVTVMFGDEALGEIVIDPLRKAVRARGGDVNAVLGTS